MRRSTLMRKAMSLLELFVAVTLLGIIAAIIVPRLGSQGRQAKRGACDVNRGNIEVQCQLWYRTKGVWPAANLSDIGANSDYFPEGLPVCPVDGRAYTFNSATQQTVAHGH